MSRICELSGKRVATGMNVSHSHIRSKRRFMPNLARVRLTSEALGRQVRLRIAASTLRSVDHAHGLDGYLLKTPDRNLSLKARRLKAEIRKRLAAKTDA
ncbi:MAG: 50S ribosomal protein L28 [Alphaproteobacteria bacterium]|nr:MAG: 50S ribosomal protein L28 [Alphaproteobacteria bacterium]